MHEGILSTAPTGRVYTTRTAGGRLQTKVNYDQWGNLVSSHSIWASECILQIRFIAAGQVAVNGARVNGCTAINGAN